MTASEAIKIWDKERMKYQFRYAKQYVRDDNNDVLNEMSFVLIHIFGLTSRQIMEIEQNGGWTNDDLLREDI